MKRKFLLQTNVVYPKAIYGKFTVILCLRCLFADFSNQIFKLISQFPHDDTNVGCLRPTICSVSLQILAAQPNLTHGSGMLHVTAVTQLSFLSWMIWRDRCLVQQ